LGRRYSIAGRSTRQEYTIDGKTILGGNGTNGTAAGRRLRVRRALLAASLAN